MQIWGRTNHPQYAASLQEHVGSLSAGESTGLSAVPITARGAHIADEAKIPDFQLRA